ncbi:MAG TPA: DUF1800 domain-containing protein [Campylobacterales bacterium]|nr:DUF1800 domain-containing protein [Campylobacterales bacterium]
MLKKITFYMVVVCFSSILLGCGSSSEPKAIDTSPQTYKVSSAKEASSFLSRATFGATMEDIEDLVKKGDYEQWIEAQYSQKPSYHLEWAKTHSKGIGTVGDLKDNPEDWRKYSDGLGSLQRDAWWDIAVFGNDQLRQRVAFALSEIMVISRFGSLVNQPDARISYYDVLIKNAFGNFETLLQEVTYHPAMGKYLTYLGNAKTDPAKGNHPDENYAREVMQLFSIGLYQLNLDGTEKTDAKGKALPTYTQRDIEEMAKVFTGLSDQNDFFFASDGGSSHKSRTEPMVAYEEYHDRSEKLILGHKIPAGGDTKTDINLALKHLFNHPNTGVFIAKRLIQRLVTSNPTAGYIKHVALAFNDNGKGVRGDLKAVVKAILLYKEDTTSDTFGKLKEPLLFISHLFRAFGAQKSENILYQEDLKLYRYASYNFNGTGYTMQEGALEALTVFNYFTPEDAPYSLKKQGLAAPEFELFGIGSLHQLLMGLINKDGFIYDTYKLTAELQLSNEKSLLEAKKYDELLDRLNVLLLGGNMSLITKTAIKTYMTKHSNLSSDVLARYVISLVMTSPDFAIQR